MLSKRFGLIGKSLSHSFSKDYFTQKFIKSGIVAEYSNFEIAEISEIRDLLKTNLSGLNVTIPYKESVLPYLDEVDETAKRIGAVNTIVFRQGKTVGFNTDVFGFRQMIKPYLTPQHGKAMILGTGGASKAVCFVLEELGIDLIRISRTPSAGQFGYEDINPSMMDACLLIVNCTPVGMYPNVKACPEMMFGCIGSLHLVIDLIYNPAKTVFLEEAALRGATVLNGQTMLEQQAEKSWELWNAT